MNNEIRLPSRYRPLVAGSHAFTLLELLVVITIMMMLIGILMPSLARTREIARRVICGSNLRQLGVAYEAYMADDQQSYLPSGYWKVGAPWGGEHPSLTLANINVGGHPINAGILVATGHLPTAEGVFFCPSRDPYHRFGARNRHGWYASDVTVGWMPGSASCTVESSYTYRGPRKWPPAGKPGILAAEVFFWDTQIYPDGSSGPYLGFYHGPPACHQDGYMNTLFSDGSVRPFSDVNNVMVGYHHFMIEAGMDMLESLLQ